MPPEVSTFASALAALILVQMAQPYAAVGVGCFVGGYAIGASKNRTAFAELGRGLFFGILAGLVVWLLQQALIGGGA